MFVKTSLPYNYVVYVQLCCNLCVPMQPMCNYVPSFLLKYVGFNFLNVISEIHKILLQSHIDHYIMYAPMVKICVIYNSSQCILTFTLVVRFNYLASAIV
jgi:hypothetical protein